jgi:hypothetical protein
MLVGEMGNKTYYHPKDRIGLQKTKEQDRYWHTFNSLYINRTIDNTDNTVILLLSISLYSISF